MFEIDNFSHNFVLTIKKIKRNFGEVGKYGQSSSSHEDDGLIYGGGLNGEK